MIFSIILLLIVCTVADNHETTIPIEIVGNKFFQLDKQFFIKGVAYQKSRQEGEPYDNTKEPHYIDSMANPFSCLRDLEYLKDLGINVVRVYQISPTANHDVCMDAFAKEGIFVIADLSEPYNSIKRDSPNWDTNLFTRYRDVIDTMYKYDNLLGFFAGNEVANSPANIDASPFIRSAVRDCKKYIEEQNYRRIPIGYASNDNTDIRMNLANYLVCDLQDEYSQIDFFAINVYEWCGYSSYTESGYRELTSAFQNYPVPVFFSEFGCNTINPRPFTEIEAIYGPAMSKVWSGGITYEYFEEENHYGLVIVKKDGQLVKLPDFENLKDKFEAVESQGISRKDVGSKQTILCPSNDKWFTSHNLPNNPDQGKCECVWQSLECVVIDDNGFNEESFLSELCRKVDCKDIMSDGRLGNFGKFSDCNPMVKASYALNKYYDLCDKDESVCIAQGKGKLIKNNVNLKNKYSSDGRNCQALLYELDDDDKDIKLKKPLEINSKNSHNKTSIKLKSLGLKLTWNSFLNYLLFTLIN